MIEKLTKEAVVLLQSLIATESFSGEEDETAQLIENWFITYNIEFKRANHNVYAFNKYFDEAKPTMLLNSHHDTVKPNSAYTKNPFNPEIKDGKLFGLGSNDAGGCLVSLLALFTYYYNHKNLKYNLVIVASAEEESSGKLGLNSVLPILPKLDVAIVGEPTLMQLAISEKGLLVLDCYAYGKAGHAAHGLGDNSIYKAMEAIKWFKEYEFPKISETLGNVKMTVTQIEAGSQHNVIPAECHFVVDVRITDAYSNIEVLEIIKNHVQVDVKERSLRLNSSSIPKEHSLVKAGIELGRETYGSPTLSDQAVLTCPSLKLGPGDSLRSHSADEFIYIHEIEEGVRLYIELLKRAIVE
ncbi:M20/M25/M40 family metallo-hydrolase [Aureibaculum marinum]|uniref:M20/M25/M40 family metallo-hydrolase n=1 Tax=Aureibaculum marinum TaxID=2487930 RepID=A0A3N4NVU4_9FLAO|nr:M20 family metallo-hydrolase [Aureibaculum marinum]RPE00225.1 M20/M25/M40 family metallo-hydrolase [Aureibaculum marinum]